MLVLLSFPYLWYTIAAALREILPNIEECNEGRFGAVWGEIHGL